MKKVKLFVIDDNIEFTEMLKEYFEKVPNMDISLTAKDGNEGIELIKNQKDEFDVILLDLIMPNRDGLKVLEYLNNNQIFKKVIVITSYSNQEIIRKVASLGACYFILKPFALEDLEEKINILTKEESNSTVIDLYHLNLQQFITKTLHELGVPTHIKGYNYIKEGILLVYEDPEHLSRMKELYPIIAKRFTSNVKNVERSIRHAIEISWNRGDWELMEDLFGHSIDMDKAKPTNSEYIITIADKLRLEFT